MKPRLEDGIPCLVSKNYSTVKDLTELPDRSQGRLLGM